MAKARQARGASGRRSILPGDLLIARGSDLGAGKAARPGPNGGVVLEFFDNPDAPPHTAEFPHAALMRFQLSEGERVFWRDAEEHWRSGRVLYAQTEGDDEYAISTGGGRALMVPERDLHVRWLRPLDDVVGFAANDLNESPYLAETRRPFLAAVNLQRAASRGFGSLSSAVVQLHAHQLEVARRVLDDPVQRYLLADEVGLGKTIEAGLIIRQLAMDSDDLTVGLIAPPFLLEQWKRELTGKFLAAQLPGLTIDRWSSEDPASWQPRDLLVVDEAHRIAGHAGHVRAEFARAYEQLRAACHGSQRLLLLSATPVLSDDRAFLSMLHLLEPEVHRPDDLDAFRARLAARQELGRLLLGLDPELPGVLLRPLLKDLATLLPDDRRLGEHVGHALRALETDDRDAARRSVISTRVHLSEMHRLHRRMLRTRRTDALRGTFRVGGRSAPESLPLDAGDLDGDLSAWREEAIVTAGDDVERLRSAALLLGRLVEAGSDPAELAQAARDAAAAGQAGDALLERIAGFGDNHRIGEIAQAVADSLLSHAKAGRPTVVFAGTPRLAEHIAAAAAELLGEERVATHIATNDAATIEAALEAFANPARAVDVLVCDSSAEEGRNLQFANLLVHVGLPSDPNRLEQRIGRLDRLVLTEHEWHAVHVNVNLFPRHAAAWEHVLANGFHVFSSSIASLQHAVGAAAADAWRTMLVDGPHAAEAAAASVRAHLAEEERRVREQDAIDAIEAVPDERTVHDALQDFEAREAAFARVGGSLLGGEGNLRFGVEPDPVTRTGSYLKLRGRGKRALHPLLPTWRVRRLHLRNLLDGRRVTWRRSVALQRPGTALLRYGDPLVDEITELLLHDHVGRSWAIWRSVDGWTRSESAWFRFDLLVEAGDASIGLPPPAARVASRRADSLLPPIAITRWMDLEGRGPSDDDRELLELPYSTERSTRGHRDLHLRTSRMDALESVLPSRTRSAAWRSAEAAVMSTALEDPDVAQRLARARSDAERLLPVRRQQLELRRAMTAGREVDALDVELALERDMQEAIAAAINEPRVRIDGVGLVVLAADLPQTDAADEPA